MSEDVQLTIRYEETEDGHVIARIAEVPAAVSFGPNREEARESVLDALRELALSYLDEQAVEGQEGEGEAIRIHAALA